MIINSKLSDDDLLDAIYNAALEYSELAGNSYLIIGKNRKSDYFWFQCYFEKKHFMHLLGIDSRSLSATEFYDKCNLHNKGMDNGIKITDCTPSRNHSRKTVNEKSSCCAEMFRIQEAKYMKVGMKNKISQYVDFTYGYGSVATLGFQKQNETSFPITLIPKSIDEFMNQKYKVAFVLQKDQTQKKYRIVVAEIKKGLFKDMYEEFPDDLKKLIENDQMKIEAV